EWVTKPLQDTKEVVIPLRAREAKLVPGERQQLGPPLPEDLHAAQSPAEPLLLQPVKVERHHPGPVGGAVVHAAVPPAEHAQASLGILGDARLAPSPDL